ncbi:MULTISPECIES: DUF4145 domain-containing protein [Sulfitobacter]|uniref:DUF4145 domain-containing protein n=1 Tax=Sulfitobacter TaxID=60136 RepID=UPI00245911EF|nr:DUF4145 domain-containing protein [Sulfitobacter faviae]MDH4541072.1 hypothetical protein [Sulfitobacter faviae]
MGTVPFDCPHVGCLTKNVGVVLTAAYSQDGTYGSTFGYCPVCSKGIVLYFRRDGGQGANVAHQQSTKDFFDCYTIIDSAPKPPNRDVVGNLPGKIAGVFDEAEANFADGRHMSAATMYRKSIELTLKDLNPEGKGMLNARIRALQKEEAVPDTLIKLLDTVKFLGNEGAHDDEPPSPEDVERGRDFTRLFLVYSYELPARVKAALAKDGPE